MDDDFMALRHQSQEKIEKGDYDVFISYNSKDREEVNEISILLMDNGIAPWFDKRDLSAGNPWWPEAERELQRSKAVAVCVGRSGFGPCQKEEIKIAHEQQKQRGIPVIPVLLAGAEDDFILSSEIKDNTWVDFRKSDPFRRTDPDPLERLIFGITGRPGVKPLRPFVLIATLGESPAVVPAMYDLLTQREGLTIGRVNVLYPEEEEEENTGRAYDLVREALEELDSKKRLRGWPLPFKDANSWKNACKFLKDLFQLLEEQDANARVCLSLAGGRKSMAALMAWVAPFFPCVKKLYHVLDPDEDHFPSLEELESMPHTLRERVLRPGPEQLKRLILVDIPFGEGQHISPRLRQKLRSATYDELALYGATFVHDLMQKDAAIPAPPPVPGKGRESVLIVPLGEFPMVATQLYTLLTKQAQRSIREVVLVYPQSQGIENAARIVKEALEETRVKCTRVPIRGLRDIDSRDACTRYQQALEDAIDQARAAHPACIIDLALSGGHQGMTAMTIFAAQKKDIFEVYHTLITDDNLSERLDNETNVSALEKPGLSHAECNARLFLRAYEGEGPYTKFLLFSLPVFPAGDQ